MSLFDEVKELGNEGHAKWFERYFNRIDLENRIKIFAAKGITSCTISVDNKKDDYLKTRLFNSKTIDMLRYRLGDGFSVELKTETIKSNVSTFFDITKTYIEISW